MQIKKIFTRIDQLLVDAIIVPVTNNDHLKWQSQGLSLYKSAEKTLAPLIKMDFLSSNGITTIPLPQGIKAKILIICSIIKPEEDGPTTLRDALIAGLKEAQKIRAASVAIAMDDFLDWLPTDSRSNALKIFSLALCDLPYTFDRYKTKSKTANTRKPKALSSMTFCFNKKLSLIDERSINAGEVIAAGMKLTKDLGNLPGNVCTPAYLAKTAKDLAKQNRLKVTVIDQSQLEKMGAGAFVAVARGSREPGKLIILEYKGGSIQDKPYVLVGKGITFDTGGISIKPAGGMDEMKYDMCGAASVLGVMQVLSQLKPKINVIGVIAAAENMPDGNATRPGDIVTSLSGKTIEILNTDAEGRLVLCDALTYIGRYKPKIVIDIATLTGACIVALGHMASGLLSNNNGLASDLLKSGESILDPAWQLPLWKSYRKFMESPFADLANISSGKGAGTITAASFLSHFTEDYVWAHLDVAGTAWENRKSGATGRPVPLLCEYLLTQANTQTLTSRTITPRKTVAKKSKPTRKILLKIVK
ncbi:MAG: leucyl aminopeptidase [Pseudomonadota bacterium]